MTHVRSVGRSAAEDVAVRQKSVRQLSAGVRNGETSSPTVTRRQVNTPARRPAEGEVKDKFNIMQFHPIPKAYLRIVQESMPCDGI